MKQVVITTNRSHGNSFGDRTYDIAVEYRIDGKVVESKVFSDTAQEGEHADMKQLLTWEIQAWAKDRGTKFTGEV